MRLYIKITLLMLLVGFLPLMMIAVFYFVRVEAIVRHTAHYTLSALALEVSKEIGRTLEDGYQNIRLLAQNPILVSSTASKEEQREELTKTRRFHQIFKDITLLNPAGQIRASVFYSFRGSWKTTEWFTEALKGKIVLSDVHAVLYPFEIVITLTSPIKDKNGQVSGVLVAQLDMEKIWNITKDVSAGEEGEVWIIDQRGIVVASPDPELLLEPVPYQAIRQSSLFKHKGFGQNGSRYNDGADAARVRKVNKKDGVLPRITDDKAKPKIGVYMPVLTDDFSKDFIPIWSVLIIQPHKEAYAALYQTRRGLIFAVLACFIVVSILSFFLSHQVSGRVSKLVEIARNLGQSDFSKEVEDLGHDEIGELGKVINWAANKIAFTQNKIIEYSEHLEEMVNERTSELKSTQAQLIETAHLAGMAEVATGVLHNIGNAVNSVNVRLNLVLEKIKPVNTIASKRLEQVVGLIKANFGHLDQYLMDDPKGKKLIPYMELAMSNMSEESGEILTDLNFLHDQIIHICEIVTLQQSYAKGRGGYKEKCSLDAIISDSIRMQEDFITRNAIRVETDFACHNLMLLERHQLMQVLVNFIKNAAQSIVTQNPDQKVIIISSRWVGNNGQGPNLAEIIIKDTGTGFSSDIKNKMFNYGFSTKKDSAKGFGLHFCANYLQSIGGKVQAKSDGQGQGAEFIIQIPIKNSEQTTDKIDIREL